MSRQSESARQGGGNASEEAEPVTAAWAASMLPRRGRGAHKWGVGGVVIVAGSPLYAGAAALCAAACGRSGAGIVSAAVPRSIAPVVVGLVPETTIVFLPEGDSVSVAFRAGEAISERLEQSRSLIVGPGLGSDDAAVALLRVLFGFIQDRSGIGFGSSKGTEESDGSGGLIARAAKPVVVDADGLNFLAQQSNWWERVPAEFLVLTPHPGEMARLTDQDVSHILEQPLAVARDAALQWRQTVVLKGETTLVASPDGTVRGVETSPALATAGSGDVLSGGIGAFLAQGLAPADAASLAVYLGAMAARRLSSELGVLGVVAGDLPQAIAREIAELEKRGRADG
ncbi:MAG: ADP/ATP-dependent (S)-NAD(P)H-hydrate dehydratase [Thermomicrobiales bacterium]